MLLHNHLSQQTYLPILQMLIIIFFSGSWNDIIPRTFSTRAPKKVLHKNVCLYAYCHYIIVFIIRLVRLFVIRTWHTWPHNYEFRSPWRWGLALGRIYQILFSSSPDFHISSHAFSRDKTAEAKIGKLLWVFKSKCFFLQYSSAWFKLYSTGASLEGVRGVRPHPLRFDSGRGAPLLRMTNYQ